MLVTENPVSGPVRLWLRLEGLAAFMLAVHFYWRMQMAGHASWLIFAIFFLAPDLAMLGFLAGARAGAAAYNIVHSYVLPLALTAFATLAGHRTALPYALIWIAHIGLDRVLGYGLKYSSGFGHTHLGWIGKQRTEEAPRLS
jgi:Domain of unknown function (DUF4260)